METINLGSLPRNTSTPIVAPIHPTPGTFTINSIGSVFGAAPPKTVDRKCVEGVHGQEFSLTPPGSEVGTFIKTLPSSEKNKYYQDVDGFNACAARSDPTEGLAGSMYLGTPNSTEFRVHFNTKVPNDWAFPGQVNRETRATGASVLKLMWIEHDDGSGPLADICIPTFIGNNVAMSGNSSQPNWGRETLMRFDEWWSWNKWNGVGYYQKSGTPDPVVNAGHIESYFSSNVTGSSFKLTNTTRTVNDTPVYGTGTDIESNPYYNRFYLGNYFVDVETDLASATKNYKSNILLRDIYISCGANSYQCLFLLNANSITNATSHVAIHASSWTQGTGPGGSDQITFNTLPHHTVQYTHCAVLKSDRTWQYAALEDIRI